tara:strand:+ start:517 stop:990 length:474 start_codon:yes stop_codon:yes gene_type:complete
MLNIKKNISINASAEKVWNFLLSLRYSMLMNRSYTKVDFPLNLEDSFKIHQNLAIVKYIFDTTIDSKNPFKELTLTKTLLDKPEFSHSISYIIISSNNNLKLDYHLSGDFGSVILEMSLKPILHGIIIDELRNIKLAIESSDKLVEDYHSLEKLKPI